MLTYFVLFVVYLLFGIILWQYLAKLEALEKWMLRNITSCSTTHNSRPCPMIRHVDYEKMEQDDVL